MKNILTAFLMVLTVFVPLRYSSGAGEILPKDLGIYEQLGNTIPLDASFKDEQGNPVVLRSLVNKPTLLNLIYYRCPNICSPLLSNLARVVDQIQLQPGVDYNIITISIDPAETPEIARDKKEEVLKEIERKNPQDSWHFLTGDEANIRKVADAAGMKFEKQQNESDVFAHPEALVVLAPDGKITRYIQGISYVPMDVQMALNEARMGKTAASRPPGDSSMGPAQDRRQYLSFCYSFNKEEGRYVLNLTRVVGLIVLLFAAAFVSIIVLRMHLKRRSLQT